MLCGHLPVSRFNPVILFKQKGFIKFLITHLDAIAQEQNLLPAFLPGDEKKGIGVFSRETAFVPRVGSIALSDKIVIDAINEDISISELNDLWGIWLLY